MKFDICTESDNNFVKSDEHAIHCDVLMNPRKIFEIPSILASNVKVTLQLHNKIQHHAPK